VAAIEHGVFEARGERQGEPFHLGQTARLEDIGRAGMRALKRRERRGPGHGTS